VTKRVVVQTLRLTVRERAAIRRAAKAARVTVTQWLRRAIAQALPQDALAPRDAAAREIAMITLPALRAGEGDWKVLP